MLKCQEPSGPGQTKLRKTAAQIHLIDWLIDWLVFLWILIIADFIIPITLDVHVHRYIPQVSRFFHGDGPIGLSAKTSSASGKVTSTCGAWDAEPKKTKGTSLSSKNGQGFGCFQK